MPWAPCPPLPPGPLARAWVLLRETTTHWVDHEEVLAHLYAVSASSTGYVIMTAAAAALAFRILPSLDCAAHAGTLRRG